jgi:hypothetical protein
MKELHDAAAGFGGAVPGKQKTRLEGRVLV